MYQEAEHAGETVYLSKHTGPDQAGALDNTSILSPYPALEQLQQKRLAARRHKTTFAYDFPHVFGNALRKVWIDRDASGEYDGPQPGLLLCMIWCCLMVHAQLLPTWVSAYLLLLLPLCYPKHSSKHVGSLHVLPHRHCCMNLSYPDW